MVTHNLVLKAETGQYVVTGQSIVLRVKTAAELRDALQRKHEPIAFDDKRMERLFNLFTKWWIPAALVAYMVSQHYQVEYRYREWRAEKTIEHSLILIPK
jgi:hypothetical protein